jgi:3-hydroxybutyrate dehydrogenase
MTPGKRVRLGQAAEMLGVSVETLRRWETEGRLRMSRSEGGQRLVEVEEVARLALYVCGPDTNSLNGTALSIDGGWIAA